MTKSRAGFCLTLLMALANPNIWDATAAALLADSLIPES